MNKIIIIGGGIAGLSAGIYAQQAGFTSEIYEKNAVAGGQCMGWNRKGHHIDNCIHWLTGTKKGTGLYNVWENLGAISENIGFADIKQFFTVSLNGKTATLWKDLERTQKELLELAPEDAKAINKFIENVKLAECCEFPVEKPMDMLNILDYIKMGKKMSGMQKVMKAYSNMNVEDLANTFKNPLVREMMMSYLPKDYNAQSLIVSYATITSGNGDIPKGGSLAMTNRIIEKYKQLGGRLHTNKNVKKIKVAAKNAEGIELCDGTFVQADYVICATDTSVTFDKLLDKSYMDKKLQKLYDNRADYPVLSGLQMAYSVDASAFNAQGTLLFDCAPFKVGYKSIDRLSLKSYSYEPSFAPEGKLVLQTNISQREDDFDYWKSLDTDEYQNRKQLIAQVVTKTIIEKFPSLEGHIELLDCWTPLTYERYCNSYRGSYMSFITKKGTKSPILKCKVDKLSNVYIASQWLMSPGGLPVAAAFGKFAIQHIQKS